jgi:hypothetical protein
MLQTTLNSFARCGDDNYGGDDDEPRHHYVRICHRYIFQTGAVVLCEHCANELEVDEVGELVAGRCEHCGAS